MQVAAIYDVHGNLPALEAALEEIRQAGVDLVVSGGDVVFGPMPGETLDALRSLEMPVQFIMGNTDREVLAQKNGEVTEWFRKSPNQRRDRLSWTAQHLSEEQAKFVSEWPPTHRTEIDELGSVLFCHATPHNDTDIFTRATPEDRLVPYFEGVDSSWVICGHTHMQFDRRIGQTRVVNAGSVGMPFGTPGAYWLLLDSTARLQQTSYDLTRAAARIQASNFPETSHFVENNVLHPPSEDEMLQIFKQVEFA